jgi:ABC-type Fe3+/spermidine/putrescine transport system ATPase subunit
VAELLVKGLSKSYAATPPILNNVDLTIRSGEFFTLLGPSGCGKTTLLRIIAGFLRQDEGSVTVGGIALDPLPPHQRDIGMVFQDYAIFPHLTVAENVAFGLKARKLGKQEVADRVKESLATVQLTHLAERLPSDLSGGQQQRVGLARAMAIRPRLLLMDEPLSNLDAKLRLELREDIRDIQRRLGITTIYVTHDQEEALAISDRICVMNKGNVEQLDSPFVLYRQPRRRFAANFVGTMNFLPASIGGDGMLSLGNERCPVTSGTAAQSLELAIRPENIEIRRASSVGRSDAITLSGTVRKTTFLGKEAHYTVATTVGDVIVQIVDPTPELLDVTGQTVSLLLPHNKVVLFDQAGDALPVLLGVA